MGFFAERPAAPGTAHSILHTLARAFPTPSIMLPQTAGVDISDSSIKWLALEPFAENLRVSTHGELSLEAGVVSGGVVRDGTKLTAALCEVRKALGAIRCVHAALPEEAAYVFGMRIPADTPRDQVLRMIEFEFENRVPIPPEAAVYDFTTILPREDQDDEISVVVFPKEVAKAYADAFAAADLVLLSLEVEASSIARAVSARSVSEPITLIVDFGRARSGLAVVKHGAPIFTSTVDVGGDGMTQALMSSLSMSEKEAEVYKNQYGIVPSDEAHQRGSEVVSVIASALADEIARHYHYWDTRRNDKGARMTPVGKIILVGGSANLRGLAEYIAGRVHAPVYVGNVWQHVASFADYIPPIHKRQSLQYATAIGLALRGT